jgi:hypothetical protein
MTFPELGPLLAASRATPAFCADLEAYAMRQPSERVTAAGVNPRVKVLRTIAQLLHAEPTLTVDRIRLKAVSGCADYVGTMDVTDGAGALHTFEFEWNCEWKARQLGYVDGFGFPDQIRAADEFGWQCFERWTRVIASEAQHVA